MITPRIETERLILREVQKRDVKDIFDCWMQDEDVSRYMWWKASNDIAEAQEFVELIRLQSLLVPTKKQSA